MPGISEYDIVWPNWPDNSNAMGRRYQGMQETENLISLVAIKYHNGSPLLPPPP